MTNPNLEADLDDKLNNTINSLEDLEMVRASLERQIEDRDTQDLDSTDVEMKLESILTQIAKTEELIEELEERLTDAEEGRDEVDPEPESYDFEGYGASNYEMDECV